MSEDWGRREPFVELDADTLRRVTAEALPGRRVHGATPLAAGHVNTNYRLNLDGGDAFVLRLHADSEDTARKERAVLSLVRGSVPAPEVVWTGACGGRPATVLRWVDGEPMTRVVIDGSDDDVRQCAEAAGETLARIGDFEFPEPGFLGPDLAITHPWGDHADFAGHRLREWLGGIAGERLGPETARKVLEHHERWSPRIRELQRRARLVHADYHGSNILARREAGAWAIAAVLDWEFAFSGIPLFDAGIMLRRTGRRRPGFEEPFLRAFAEAGGECPPDAADICRALDLLNLVQFLSREQAAPALVAFAREVVAETVAKDPSRLA